MKIAICDDEIRFVKYMAGAVEDSFKKFGGKMEISLFSDSKELMDAIHTNYFSIVFLDIDMPDFTGFDISRELLNSGIRSSVVFVSNKEECVYDAIKYQPFSFIRKSCFKTEIDHVVRRLLENHDSSSVKISLPASKQVISLDPYKILYIECHNKKMKIVLFNRTLDIRCKLIELERQLQQYGFIRIHKGYLVNYRYINSVRKSCEVILENGEHLPVSRQRLHEVFERFGELVVSQ